MLHAEMAEKTQTILEIMAHLDLNDEKVAKRIWLHSLYPTSP
jgi:hypothetical protein